MELTHPAVLWLGLAVPLLLWLRLRRRPKAIALPGLSGLKGLPKARFSSLPVVLFAISCLLLLFAASGPRLPLGETEQKIVGVDVALALDVSGSMRAEDLKPSRMEAAKQDVKQFVHTFQQGRMALVAFAGRSFTQCPLTADGGILEGLIDQLDVGSVAIDGTAIGDAIINCMNKFKESAVSRVIVLLTDGENNAGSVDPITAARAAQAKGIKIYTIGVGTPGGAPVPVTGPGGDRFYLRDNYGNIILAKVDEQTLRQIADITGGQFFRATDESTLRDIYQKIGRMEKKEITVKRVTGYRQLFPWFAGAGLLFIALGALAEARYRVLS